MKTYEGLFLGNLIFALALLSGCASQQGPASSQSDVIVTEATVTAIDLPQRRVTLKEKDGSESSIKVGDVVKNLDKVEVGDVVRITQTETIALQVRKAGEATPGASVQETANVAKAGDKPAVQQGRTVTISAAITAIDLAKGTVTLTGPEGRSETIKAANPDNLKKVAVGDVVDVIYTESIAVAVVPIKK